MASGNKLKLNIKIFDAKIYIYTYLSNKSVRFAIC